MLLCRPSWSHLDRARYLLILLDTFVSNTMHSAVPDASFSQHCVACQGIGVTRKKKKAPYNTNLYGITTWVGCGLVGVMQVLARCAFFFAGAMLFWWTSGCSIGAFAGSQLQSWMMNWWWDCISFLHRKGIRVHVLPYIHHLLTIKPSSQRAYMPSFTSILIYLPLVGLILSFNQMSTIECCTTWVMSPPSTHKHTHTHCFKSSTQGKFPSERRNIFFIIGR